MDGSKASRLDRRLRHPFWLDQLSLSGRSKTIPYAAHLYGHPNTTIDWRSVVSYEQTVANGGGLYSERLVDHANTAYFATEVKKILCAAHIRITGVSYRTLSKG